MSPPTAKTAGPRSRSPAAAAAPTPVPRMERPLTASRPALLADGSDHQFRDLVHDMLTFAHAIQEVRNRLGALIGLSGTQYTVLTAIYRLSEDGTEVGVNQVAEHLHLSGAFVTIEVNKLVAAGMVNKEPNPEDRRRVILTVTGEARARLAAMTQVQCPANDTLFEPLTEKDFRTLRTIMGKLAGTGERTLRLIDYMAPDHALTEAADT